MTTSRLTPFAQKIVTKQFSVMPSITTDLFSVSGPIQIIALTGLVEETITGTAYTCQVQIDNTFTTSTYSNALTLTGLTNGTVIDFVAPFDSARTGKPTVEPYGTTIIYNAGGTIKFIPGGTPGAGILTISMLYVPMQLNTEVVSL